MAVADRELPCGFYTVSADGTVLEINDTALALFGRSREAVAGRLNIAELLKPESRERLARQLKDAQARGPASPVEVEFLRADGSVFSALQSASPDGEGARFTVLDLSRQRQAERELRQAKDYLDNLFRSSTAPILVLNSRGGVVRPNRGFEKLSGYTQPELFGRPLQDLLPEEVRGLAESLLHEAQEGASLEGRELPVRCRSGEIRAVVWNFSLLKSESGQPPLFLAQGVDITDRKRAEGDLKKLYLVLKAINKCNEAMIYAHDEETLLEQVCRILVESGGYRLAWAGYGEKDEAKTVRPVAQFGYEEGYLESLRLTWADSERGRGPTGIAIRGGEPVVAQNILTDPRFAPWRENALKRGYASSLAVPLRAESEVLGAINIYSSQVDAFAEDEVILLGELATHLAHVVTFLRAREERRMLSEALRQTGEAVVVADAERRVRFVNAAFTRLFGYSPEAADWLAFSRTMRVPEQAEALQPERVFEAVVRDGRWEGEVRRRAKDGGGIPVYLTMAAIRDPEGETEGYVLSYLDLRQIEAVQQALRDSEEKFRQISGSAQDAILMMDDQGRLTYWNAAAERIFGFAADEAVGRDLHQLIVPEPSRAAFEKGFRSYLKTGTGPVIGHALEVTALRKNGTPFPVELSISSTLLGGRRHAIGIIRDVSGRKRAELELKASEAKYRIFADNTYDWEFWLDPEGRFVYSSPSCEKITGYTAAEFSADPDLLQRIVHPEDRAAFGEQRYGMCGSRAQTEGEFRIVTRGGQERWVGHACQPVYDEQGRFIGTRGSNRDITQRKQAEEALKQLNATLEQRVAEAVAQNREKDHLLIQQSRLAAMGEMVHNIAHQWRQPLNALVLQLANIKDEYNFGELTPERLDEDIENAVRLIRRMSSTIDDFRDFFRPSREAVPFGLQPAVEDAIRLIEASLRHDGIVLQSQWDGEATALGHPNEFSQVIINLLSNAKDAILGAGRTDGTITLRVRREGKWGVVTVADNGGGIPPEVMPKIFDPYFTTKDKGTGIGLYMSKKIVENMGGEIAAANVSGGGAEFAVRLPLAPGGGEVSL